MFRRSARIAPLAPLTVLFALVLGLGVAVADPGGQPEAPSQEQVDAAQSRVISAGDDVASLRAALAVAQQRQDAAFTRAAAAAEAYNGARYQLAEAEKRVARAERKAEHAQAEVERQRADIGAVVADSYTRIDEISALHAVLGADGPEGVMARMGAVESVNETMEADYARFRAANSLARAFQARAERERAEQAKLAIRAKRAKEAAAAAASATTGEVADLAAQERGLIRRLARAQGISVALATQRQQALAVRTRARIAREADKPDSAGSSDRPEGTGGTDKPEPQPSQTPDPAPAPEPTPSPTPDPTPPAPSGGAQQAIAFARAQIGEPYVWGAAGPDSWDCSGLTMRAWGSAGRSLPHWSVGQYQSSTPISRGQLRPGDLVFWSSNGRPSGIYHVGLYTGGGQMVHAPRTGRNVEEVSIDYWKSPNLFARP